MHSIVRIPQPGLLAAMLSDLGAMTGFGAVASGGESAARFAAI
ncbi:MAG: hypothetical protein ACKOYN_09500 [Planctomycetota bacterium]